MPADRRVLILFAHPALQKSRVNVCLASTVKRLPGVTFHDLYETYPDFDIDVDREQQTLLQHDVIIFQHPFYWYSCPALLKEWMDLVLEFGFAYGPGGTKLAGKSVMSAITTGGAESAYSRSGHNHFTIPELLAPIEQTVRLCGMRWLPPFTIHSVLNRKKAEFEAAAERYAAIVTALREDRDTAALRELSSGNARGTLDRTSS